MSMHVDADSEKEQIGTLIVWVGPQEGGCRGGGGSRGVHPKI